MGGGGNMKNSGFFPAAKGCHVGEDVGLTGRRVGDRRKEGALAKSLPQQPRGEAPSVRVASDLCPRLIQRRAVARVSGTSSRPHLRALVSSRLPPVRLSQDSIDQCLQTAPRKNDLVSKRLSHLA